MTAQNTNETVINTFNIGLLVFTLLLNYTEGVVVDVAAEAWLPICCCCWMIAAAAGPMQERAIDSNTRLISGAL